MADWEEIKRLAADFQRTQTSDTLQRISERNCIDIVKKLTDLSLIELIYTCDGKEFLTPEHLLREIKDEIYINGGRVHIHDLASNLNVDYQHVENKAKEMARDSPDEYNLILGQVIHSTYKTTLGKQIYDNMITMGQLSIADFAKSLDLPSEFLLEIVKEILPQIIEDYVASPDERTYYTTDMMDRYKSIISGTLSAITKPTTIASIMKKLDIPERMFNPIVDGLIKEGRIDAMIENRLFIPSIYAREQNEWIDKFYTTNSYIDYDVLTRKGIKQPKAFLKKRFPNGIQLKYCFVSPNLMSQVESMVEDCIASNSLMDISTILPASIQPEDIELMLQDLFKKNKQFSLNCLILHQTNVCSLGYIATCEQSFSNMMEDKAREHLKEGKLVNYFLGGKVKTPRSRQQSENLKDKQEQQSGNQEGESIKSEDKKEKDSKVKSSEQEVKPTELSQSSKQKGDDIELTAEDLKRERRHKKGKQQQPQQQPNVADEPLIDALDSDEEQSSKKSKSSGARKSGGGGTQGREIKQKSTKKKYLQGKAKQDSDEDQPPVSAKAPRSNKGRAAKLGILPTSGNLHKATLGAGASRQSKTNTGKIEGGLTNKEPLEFMSTDELIDSLRNTSRDAGDFADEMFESIASMMVDDLNKSYESLARKILDDHLRSTSASAKEGEDLGGKQNVDDQEEFDEDIDLVE